MPPMPQLLDVSAPNIFETIFMRRLDKALGIETKYEKYQALRDLSAAQTKLKKAVGQNEAVKIRQMAEELKKLSVDPDIQREETSEKAFKQAQRYEENICKQKQSSAIHRKMALKNVAAQYQQIALMYPGTVFGKQAQEKAISFQQETSK